MLRVLVLIDTVADSDMLARELRRTGFELDWRRATSETAYLAELESPLDLILADNALPEFDAMRALQILRTSEQDIPLIVLADSSSEQAAIECVSLGATDFVFKERPARLRSVVVRALDQRELRAHARATNAALRQSAAINQAVLDSLTAHIAVLNGTGVIVAVNQAWERFARANGDPNRLHTHVGINYLDICRAVAGDTNAEAQQVTQGIAAVLARELDQYTIEYPCHSPSEERWFIMRVTPLAGEHTGAVVAHENITERTKAGLALRESEARFRTTFEQAAAGIAHLAPSGQFLRVNKRLCDIFGYSHAELLDCTLHDLNIPELVTLAQAGARRLLAREIVSYSTELRFIRKNNSSVWINMTVSLVCDDMGAPSYFIALVEDITERWKAATTRALLAAIVDSSDDAIIGVALDGTVMSWNTGAEHLYGYRADQMLGQPIAALQPVHLQEEAAQVYERLAGSGTTAHVETVRRRSDGQLIDVALAISVINNAGGGIGGFSTISRDISARKRADQALRQTTAFVRLLQEVAVAANQATSLEQALQTAIDKICEHIGWPVGHVYMPDPAEPGALLPTHIWHLEDPQRFATFRKITEVVRLAPEIGLPGQVMNGRKSAWISDMDLDVSTPRTRLIRNIGVRAGFALPVLVGAEVAAVLEFFATEAIEPDEALLDVLDHVGTQLGRVVERARAEAALRAAEAQYRMLVEQIPAIIYTAAIDARSSTSYVSPQIEAILGFSPEEWIANPDLWLAQVHPDDRARMLETISHAHSSDAPIPTEYRSFTRDGRMVWLRDAARVVRDEASRPLFMRGVTLDITDRKQAEAALAEREAYFRALIEHSADAVALLGVDGTILYGSPATPRILGYELQDFVGRSAFDLIHPEDRSQVAQKLAHIIGMPEATVSVQARVQHADGSWRDLESKFTNLLGDPAVGAIVNNYRDITERKRAEEALHTSERLYRTLASNFPNGAVVLFDHDLRFTITDGAGLADLGLTRERAESHTIWEIFTPDACAAIEPIYRAALAGTPHVREIALGEHTYVVHTLPVRDERGEIIAGMEMTQNITERKRIEEALIDERALLARRVDERTADLSAANAELARAAILKDEFLASMSHELRTPLNAVLGLSEALQEEVYGSLNDRQRRSLHSIAESGRHLLELINDILDLAKIGAGKLDLNLEPAAIAPICQASLRLIKQIAYKKQLSVDMTIDPVVTLLHVDARRLKQILVNLLSNAVKFTPEGGSIGLEVVGDVARQAVDLTIWDTGIGIAQEQMQQLFQPFVQLDSRLARQYEGTGLGLALVYRMVEMHGGSVAVTSEIGRGSRFTVALPWPTASAAVPAVQEVVVAMPSTLTRAMRESTLMPAPRARGIAPPLVLLAEDNEATITLIADYLGTHGYQVVVARNGAEAIARAREARPAIILMDIQMPGMDGLEAIRRIRITDALVDLPIIALTALAMPGDRERCLVAGATDYLSKPVYMRGLAVLIEHSLRPHSSQQRSHP